MRTWTTSSSAGSVNGRCCGPGVACDGCPPLAELVDRYAKAGGRYLVCPICFDARQLDKGLLIEAAELGGTVPMWQWIGDDGATTFSY